MKAWERSSLIEQSLVLLIQDRDWSNDCSLYCYCDLGRTYPKPFAVETKNHFSNIKPIKENLNNENPKAWKPEDNLVSFQLMKSLVVISALISVETELSTWKETKWTDCWRIPGQLTFYKSNFFLSILRASLNPRSLIEFTSTCIANTRCYTESTHPYFNY